MREWLKAEGAVRQQVESHIGPNGALLTKDRLELIDTAFANLERLHQDYRDACARAFG